MVPHCVNFGSADPLLGIALDMQRDEFVVVSHESIEVINN